ncbi:sodium-type flagellar protein MotX [Vibrio sp. JCM 19053]|nr:sodium-type flagellar protein MotX [Vibrio sp. JCM 19053]
MKLRTVAASLLLTLVATTVKANVADVGAPVPIYTEAELIKLIEQNKHLQRVRADNCQLVEDIVARATRINLPAYEFLYGDMLAWGVCVEQDVELGLYYIENAAHQGLPAALEQIGRYYSRGTLVQQDKERAIPYLREAASMGNLNARIHLAELLLRDYGSPLDYEDAYRWLYNSVTADKRQHKRITVLRNGLNSACHKTLLLELNGETPFGNASILQTTSYNKAHVTWALLFSR